MFVFPPLPPFLIILIILIVHTINHSIILVGDFILGQTHDNLLSD
jgi:hypothetical protein